MPINIFNRQAKIRLGFALGAGFGRKFLLPLEKKLRLTKTSGYNIILLDDAGIKKLNKMYLGKNSPTDVLSFRYSACSADIFISLETAKANAALYGQKFQAEFLRLIIHGILHARGYTDYERGKKEKMWKKQEGLLKCLHC